MIVISIKESCLAWAPGRDSEHAGARMLNMDGPQWKIQLQSNWRWTKMDVQRNGMEMRVRIGVKKNEIVG